MDMQQVGLQTNQPGRKNIVRMEEHAQAWIRLSEQTIQTNNFDVSRADRCIHCCSQPRLVLGASGACLTSGYYVLLALDHSLSALRGCFHAALLLSVSCGHGRGVVCTGNRIGTDKQHDM